VARMGHTHISVADGRIISKIYLSDIECMGVDWIQLDQGRVQQRTLVNTVIHLRVP
jgi:hypothetical protein